MTKEDPASFPIDNNTNEDLKQNKNIISSSKQSETLDEVREKYGPTEHRRILRNLVVLGFSFVLLFTSFQSMSILQTSLNTENGLGLYSLATVYLSLLISSFFIPSIMIHKLTCKWTLVVSMIGYATYIAVQFHPTFFTLIPAAILLGMCASPLWSAQSVYLTKIGEEYAYITGESSEVTLQRFFGVFYLIFQTAHIWGNLMAALLLASNENSTVIVNEFEIVESIQTKKCGIDFCPAALLSSSLISQENQTSLLVPSPETDKPDKMKIYILATLFLIFSVAAASVLAFVLDSLNRFGESVVDSSKPRANISDRFIGTIRNWKSPRQLLLIAITTWVGFEQGWIGADFTMGYISCALGVHQIGYIFICYGAFNSISSFAFGRLIKYIGRPTVFIIAFISQFFAVLLAMYWNQYESTPVILYAIGGLFGIGDGILTAQLFALNGSLFPDSLDAAFSNNRLANSLGYLIAYIFANKLCMEIKLYICLVAITLSIIAYSLVEFSVRQEKRRSIDLLDTLNKTKGKF